MVGGGDGRHPLGDDHDGGLGGVRPEGGPEPGIGEEVERREGVVEQVDLGLAHQRPGDGEPLALAAGDVAAALLDAGLEAAGHGPARSRRPGRPRAPPTSPPRWRRACRSGGCWRPCPENRYGLCGTSPIWFHSKSGSSSRTSTPSTSTSPLVASKRRAMSFDQRRLAGAGAADDGGGLPGPGLEGDVARARRARRPGSGTRRRGARTEPWSSTSRIGVAGGTTDGSVSSTSWMRPADTAERGIIDSMNVAIITDIRICTR